MLGLGNDTANGDEGNDIFYGSFGYDTLTGSEGADTFVFNSRVSYDRIRGFSSDDDAIHIDGDVFAGFAAGELRSDDFFVGSNPLPKGSDAAILFNTAAGQFTYDSDGAGAGGRVILADFDTGRPSADDISII